MMAEVSRLEEGVRGWPRREKKEQRNLDGMRQKRQPQDEDGPRQGSCENQRKMFFPMTGGHQSQSSRGRCAG